jgi:hypothetical protein
MNAGSRVAGPDPVGGKKHAEKTAAHDQKITENRHHNTNAYANK